MKFSELPEFSREFRRYAKKYLSLPSDLREFKEILAAVPLGNSKHFAVLACQEHIKIVKARFFCRYLKGSALRMVYAYYPEPQAVEFIEIYAKNEKSREDYSRIRKYLKKTKFFYGNSV